MIRRWLRRPRRDSYALWGCRRRDCQIGSELDRLAQRVIAIYRLRRP